MLLLNILNEEGKNHFRGIGILSKRLYQPFYLIDAIWKRTKQCKELSDIADYGEFVTSHVRNFFSFLLIGIFLFD